MTRSTTIHSAFNGGELSPRVFGRIDIDKYRSSSEVLENFVATTPGAAVLRSGTRHVTHTKNSEVAALIPFRFSDLQSYVIEAGDGYMRFFTQEAQLLSGSSPLEIVSPYSASDVFDLRYAQSADVLYIVHPIHAPRKLERTAAASFALSEVDFFDGPFDRVNLNVDHELTLVAISGDTQTVGSTFTMTATGSGFTPFAPEHVGRLVRFSGTTPLPSNPEFAVYRITAFTSDTEVEVELVLADRLVGALGPSALWRLGSWYEGNYPSAVSFHDQRLVFAADPSNPQTFYLSVIGDFENFAQTGATNRPGSDGSRNTEINADNAFAYTISAKEVNKIEWIGSLKTLIMGTSDGIYAVRGASELDSLTPANVGARRNNQKGSSDVLPAFVDDAAIYMSPTNRKVYRTAFAFERDTYLVEDMTVISDHITRSGIKQMQYAPEPYSIVWALREDGKLAALTIDTGQQVAAWSRHPVAGEDVAVEAIAVIPSPPGTPVAGAHENVLHDQLWMVVRRTVNGVTLRSVEFMEDFFPDDVAIQDAFFVDAGVSYEGAPVSEIADLGHMEGESVMAVADGAKAPGFPKVVSGGKVSLDEPASRVHVGLPYLGRAKPVRLEAGDPEGTSQGKSKRIDHLTIRLYRSMGGRVSADAEGDLFDPIDYENAEQPLGAPPALFTGDIPMTLDAGWSTAGQYEVRQDEPYPMTLVAAMHRVESSPRGR